MRWMRLALGAALAGALASAHAAFPDRPVRLVVPFAAGSGLDKLARVTGERLSREFGQQVVVENISGAGGNVGVDSVLKSQADGYTLLFATTNTMVINPHLSKRQKRTPLSDFSVVGPVQMATNVLAVRPDLPIQTLPQFIAFAKANPGKLSYGSSGVGSSSHLGASMLAQMASVELTHVPYRGSSAAASDFLGGRLDFMMDGAGQYVQLAGAGKVRVLGTTSTRRFAGLPQWQPLADAGLAGFDVTIWTAVMTPKGTPQPVVDVLRRTLAKVVGEPEFRAAIAPDEPFIMTVPAFESFLLGENTKWERLVRESGASSD